MVRETDRQALINLIINAKRTDPETGSFTEWLADFLLGYADREGRVVVLPAKPDQTIYQWRIGDDCPSVSRLDGVQINADGEITYPIWCGHLTPGDFGKTVFLTREEAKKALGDMKDE